MNVLITNDDGIMSPYFHALYFALQNAGHEVFAAAPMSQQSGVSHALTFFDPLRAKEVVAGQFKGMGVYGTPTDCVKLALGVWMDKRPDLVISGINQGQNVGPDILYSGTVAAAAEAAHDNLPAMAVSHASHMPIEDIDAVAEHAVKLAEKLDWGKIGPRRVVNVNYPECPIAESKGIKICPQSRLVWKNVYQDRIDPRGVPYWWLRGAMDEKDLEQDSDKPVLAQNYITITSLKYDFNDYEGLDSLAAMGLDSI